MRVLCVAAVSGTVYSAAISTTLLDRSDIKQWLGASKLYDNDTLISVLFTEQPNTIIAGQNLISNEAIQHALERTFPASFLRQNFEHVVDKSYDWIEGREARFAFSVPVDTKRQTFIAELAKEIEPKIAALPICNLTIQTPCRPNVPVPDFVRQLVIESITASDFLQAPLTESVFIQSTSTENTAVLSRLPMIYSTVMTLLWALPLVFLISLVGAWLLTPHGSKQTLLIRLSRGIFSSTVVTIIIATTIILIEQFRGFSFETVFTGTGSLAPVLGTFLTKLIIGFSWALLLFAAIGCFISVISWIILLQIKKRTPKLDTRINPAL